MAYIHVYMTPTAGGTDGTQVFRINPNSLLF